MLYIFLIPIIGLVVAFFINKILPSQVFQVIRVVLQVHILTHVYIYLYIHTVYMPNNVYK